MLSQWTVIYRDQECSPSDLPEAFSCMADDSEHAEEQCENAYPKCEVIWTHNGAPDAAYSEWRNATAKWVE